MQQGAVFQKACAVIRISEFNESCEHALASIIENPSFFNGIVLVKFGFSSHLLPFPDFPAYEASLKAANIPLIWQSSLDATKLPCPDTRAIVWLEPDVHVANGALKGLFEDMTNQSQDHYAVSSLLAIESDRTKDPRTYFSSLWYGFLLVILMLDTFRSIFAVFGYSRTVDVRAQLLSITYPNKVRLAPHRWWMWWIGTGVATTRNGQSAAIQMPMEKDQGVGLVLRTIKTHNHMSIGTWLLFYAFYYALFAWPWYNYVLSPKSTLGMWLMRDMTAWYWQVIYLLHTALVALVAWLYVLSFPKTHVPLVGDQSFSLPLQVLLYTVYLTLSPIIFLYGRFHVSRASWQSATAAFKKKPLEMMPPAKRGAEAQE